MQKEHAFLFIYKYINKGIIYKQEIFTKQYAFLFVTSRSRDILQ